MQRAGKAGSFEKVTSRFLPATLRNVSEYIPSVTRKQEITTPRCRLRHRRPAKLLLPSRSCSVSARVANPALGTGRTPHPPRCARHPLPLCAGLSGEKFLHAELVWDSQQTIFSRLARTCSAYPRLCFARSKAIGIGGSFA